MLYKNLGRTDIKVSRMCLGSMTWGYQNTAAEANLQMQYAFDHGVTFWDTAELYSIPPSPELYGMSEKIMGDFLQQNPGLRQQLVIGTKVCGFGIPHVNDGNPVVSEAEFNQAVDGSLKRLNTDYIDLYQIHWPARNVPKFGMMDFQPQWMDDDDHIEEMLINISKLVQSGKVRAIGLSNETPWGTMKFLHLADKLGLQRIVSVQNPYSMITRHYDSQMAEVSYREDVGLIAYSALGGGSLTGKYRGGSQPEGARMSTWGKPRYAQYGKVEVAQAVDAYYDIAQKHGLSLTQMAYAWVNHQPWVASNIIGATSLDQLAENIDSIHVELSPEIMDEILQVHGEIRNPTNIVKTAY